MEQAEWKEAVIYQVYPPSFKDGDGDGLGDLPGILSKLDYLEKLGVGIIWLGPVYQSPFADNGYDISDYKAIHTPYGTMADLERLISELHNRNMKLMMDLVINHTSDEHPWFVQSRQSKDNPYRNYYIWKPPGTDGKEPNNWGSFTGESAWQLDERTGEYYLRLFDRKQPDLNWEHEPLREEVYEIIRFWLHKGIDGFRLDAINMISKHPDFPDAPEEARHPRGQDYFKNGPRIHEFLQEMHEKAFSFKPGLITVGETPTITMEQALQYTDPARKELSMALLMDMSGIGKDRQDPWRAVPWDTPALKKCISTWYKGVFQTGWYAVYLSNHDHPRLIPEWFGEGEEREMGAKLIATLLHTIPGTPIVYQGEELGLTNARYPSVEDYRDYGTISYYRKQIQEGVPVEEALERVHQRSRDGARAPMRWEKGKLGGFTIGVPWIPMNDKDAGIDAESEMARPDSVFHYYRRLIELRKQEPVMVYGDFKLLMPEHKQLMAYTRTYGKNTWLVLLNFDRQQTSFRTELAEHSQRELKLLFGNKAGWGKNAPERGDGAAYESVQPQVRLADGCLQGTLNAYEAAVYRLV
ncbi:glycoside hydrolase family 13 protein [Paenibacillus jiagnxiensis]|uniref:glycoside hydrolase family 13 protein n=1 Tax=Paenibacillus jiagnxiensis TaxID=3228926 RepID=UPI0033AF7759